MKKDFKQGDGIKWQYTHRLNRSSSKECVKHGVFIRKAIRGEMCCVKFDGNRGISRVRYEDIEHETLPR